MSDFPLALPALVWPPSVVSDTPWALSLLCHQCPLLIISFLSLPMGEAWCCCPLSVPKSWAL